MKLQHKILAFIFYYTYIFFKKINIFKKDMVRVLMYHDIKKNEFQKIETQIKLLKKDNWNFLTPEEFLKFKIKKKKIKGKNLLITFDDGFFSNKVVSEKILSKYGIKGVFFLPTKFLISKERSKKIEFVKKNLKLYNYNSKDKKISLEEKDIKKLSKSNNFIGGHTFSHTPLNEVKNNNLLKKEIINSSRFLEKIIRKKIIFFAFPFGTRQDINLQSIKFAKKKYKLVFSAIRGNNLNNEIIIFRDNISPSYNKFFLISILNGYYDFLYFFSRKKILSFLN